VHREVRALSAVHEQVTRYAAEHAAAASAVLDDAARRTAARIAVAEVQRHHAVWSMAQLRFEVYRALPVLKPGSDGEAVVTEVAQLAVSGRTGAEVIHVTAPDITDVTSLGVRASDGAASTGRRTRNGTAPWLTWTSRSRSSRPRRGRCLSSSVTSGHGPPPRVPG
jgi:hypothetical protein